jgi:hypothetical protein
MFPLDPYLRDRVVAYFTAPGRWLQCIIPALIVADADRLVDT